MNQLAAVGLGWTLQDTLMTLGSYPREDTKAIASTTLSQVGGPCVRALLTMRSLGAQTSLISAVGSDGPGEFALEALTAAGMRMDAVEVDPMKATRLSQVWLGADSGSRTIAYSSQGPGLTRLSSAAKDAIQACALLHLDGREAVVAIEAIDLARSVGALVTLDAGSPKPELDTLVRLVDVAILPRLTATHLTHATSIEEAAERLLGDRGVKTAVVTLGAGGARAFDSGGKSFLSKGFPVQVVDSNGAGDVFAGAMAWYLARGLALEDSLTRASAAAALKCSQMGNAGIPTSDDVEHLVAKYG